MCGISGWVSFDRDLRLERDRLEAMTATMSCRGPDAEGVWLRRRAGLGNRRLAVIDIPGGAQPMIADAPRGPVGLTFSGEIYNYRELRAELRGRGHVFATNSDTEVVLRGYLEWQAGIAERLNGMYAFAVWDDPRRRLTLVRDRLGIKPLFYYRVGENVLFGSEPKAVLANSLAPAVVEMDGLRELITFSKSPGAAVWAGMREVLPGSVLAYDREGLREERYWTLSAVEHVDDPRTTVATIRELVDDIVGRQVVADVPLCVLLSGGLDSSAIAALASRRVARGSLRSYALDVVGPAATFVADHLRSTHDRPYASAIAKQIGSRHEVVTVTATELADPEIRRKTIAAKDLPIAFGDLDNSLYLLLRAIRSEATVALSGEGADEVFGGHRWFHDSNAVNTATFPWVAAPTRWRLDDGDPSVSPGWYLADAFRGSLDAATYVQDQYANALAEVPHIENANAKERRMREVAYLYLTRFLPMLLDRKDRLSMAVGLEVRIPYCDHRLVEYVFNVPWSLKTFDGREKSLLRAAIGDLLPQAVTRRAKAPFPAIRDPHYFSLLRDQVSELLSSPGDALFEMYDHTRIVDAMARFSDTVPPALALTFERLLDMQTWLDLRRPKLDIVSA